MGHRLQSTAHMWHCSCHCQWDATFRFITNKTQDWKLDIDCEILSINAVNIYPKLILRSVCDARHSQSDHDYPGLHRSNYSHYYLLQWGKCVAEFVWFTFFTIFTFIYIHLNIMINTFLVDTLFPMVPIPVIVFRRQPILTMIFRSEISRARRMKVMTKSMWICITRWNLLPVIISYLSCSALQVLCPDSRAFVLYQLYPAWESMRHIFRVNFIPYGKAYVSVISSWQWRKPFVTLLKVSLAICMLRKCGGIFC